MANKVKQKAFLKALEAGLGVVTVASKATGISRNTHHVWMKNDLEYREKVHELNDVALDFAESSLHQQIKDKVPVSTIFYLKTKGKERGYGQELELKHSGSIDVPLVTMDEETLQLEKERLLKNALKKQKLGSK